MTDLGPGSTVSHYRILETLGQGGQATAYKAEDQRLSRTVVLKTLRPELAASEAALKRFQRESCLCSQLDNPHIQAVYDVGEQDGLHFIVMQFIEGPTLKQLVGGKPLETLSALSIAIQIADALAVAHSLNIVHRDLKPSNIKIRNDGAVKVLDFGLAKMLDTADVAGSSMAPTITSPAATRAGVILGTAAYMAPEQARGQPADAHADIWAFAVVLYEMLTGVRPFDGGTVSEVISEVLKSEPD
jgi:eukaryotic-like serine/threonine-protein kinase